MKFLKELEELKRSFLPLLFLVLVLSLFFFAFGPREIDFSGTKLFLPWPTFRSFSVLVFDRIQGDLVPAEVELIVTNPLSAFLTQVIISLFLSSFIILPFFLYRLIKYLSPALSQTEKKKNIKVLLPSLLLFLAGCFFAYFLVIPATLKILYIYPVVMGVTPFFSVNEFIVFVLGLTIATGVMFLLPIFMILMSRLGIVDKNFWKKNWRYAVLIFLIFSAIITPDGSGLTMIMLSVPLFCLYFLGYLFIPKQKKVGI